MRFASTGFRLLTLLALASVLGAGCARRFIITTTNGSKIITPSKPKQVDSKFVYKDGNGQIVEIPVMRVRLIEPYSKEAAGSLPRNPETR